MFYATLGPLGYGIANALGKSAGQNVGFIRAAILLSFFATLFLSILNLFIGSWPTDTKWIIITFIFGIYGYFPLVFFIKAITTGKVGVVIPVVDMNIIYPIVLASIFLNQIISFSGIFFIFIIMLGVVIFSINFSDFKESNIFDINSGVYYALIASLLWGVGYFFWSFSIAKIGALNTSILIELGVLCAALIHLFIINKEKLAGTIDKKSLFVGIFIGLFTAIGDLGVNLGMQSVGVPVAMAIMGARPAVGAIAGLILYKEKMSPKHIFALLLVIVGVVGVSLTR